MIRALTTEEGVGASTAGMTPLLSTTLLTGPLPQEVSQVSISFTVIDDLEKVMILRVHCGHITRTLCTTCTCTGMCE